MTRGNKGKDKGAVPVRTQRGAGTTRRRRLKWHRAKRRGGKGAPADHRRHPLHRDRHPRLGHLHSPNPGRDPGTRKVSHFEIFLWLFETFSCCIKGQKPAKARRGTPSPIWSRSTSRTGWARRCSSPRTATATAAARQRRSSQKSQTMRKKRIMPRKNPQTRRRLRRRKNLLPKGGRRRRNPPRRWFACAI